MNISPVGDRRDSGVAWPRRLIAAAALAVAVPAHGHGFGQRYDLPVPLWLYLVGAASTVAVSFLLYALLARPAGSSLAYRRLRLLDFRGGRILAHPALRVAMRAVALGVFMLVLAAGFFGAQSPFKNIAPILVWAIWWVGMPYTCALLGDAWRLLNPIDTLFLILRRISAPHRKQSSSPLAYPPWLAAWPAVVVFVVAQWAELVWEYSDTPRYIASALVAYCAVSVLAMWLFGREEWLRGGEAFSVVFGVFARLGPTEVRAGGIRLGEPGHAPDGYSAPDYDLFNRVAPKDREWNLRPYGVGLLNPAPVHTSLLVLVMLMLASVTFDGFIETPAWTDALQAIAPLGAGDSQGGMSSGMRAAVHSAALLLFAIVFLVIYMTFCHAMRFAARSRGGTPPSTFVIARYFVLTLLPIAIAYHIAHYLSFLLMAGQYLIPLSSDPLGLGWDLFGTGRYFVRIAIIDARAVWYTSVAAIVAGHIAAVYLGHATAVRVFRDRAAAMASQLPMLLLMVGYTMISLWIIAQPIVTVR